MNYLGNSIAGYRAARGDRRELIFFALWAFVIFLKFFGLECEVWGRLPRAPLAYALSASLCAAFAVALSLLPRRARFACSLVLDFAFSALIVTDLLHLRFYSDLFTFHNFGLSGQVGDVSDSVFALLSPRDALYFADVPLFFAYYVLADRMRAAHLFGALNPRRVAASCAVLVISLALFSAMLYGYDRRMPNALAAMWDRPAVCCNVGAMAYHAADARNVLRESFGRKKLSEDEIAAAAEEFAAFRAKLAPPYPTAFGAAREKNLIMIQAESLQSFAVGLRVNGREVTPNLNRFAREASFAGDLYVQTGLGNSADAEFLANAGSIPREAASPTSVSRTGATTPCRGCCAPTATRRSRCTATARASGTARTCIPRSDLRDSSAKRITKSTRSSASASATAASSASRLRCSKRRSGLFTPFL